MASASQGVEGGVGTIIGGGKSRQKSMGLGFLTFLNSFFRF
jgi:hypothetical protein